MNSVVEAQPGGRSPGAGGAALGSISEHRTLIRRWVRRDTPVWPFVWRGLLPLLGLAAVTLYAIWPWARGDVEASVRQHVRAALDANGHGWAAMDVSGQDVRLSGTPPAASDGAAALEIARRARCPAWGFQLVCAVKVTGAFDAATAPPSVALPATASPTAALPATAAPPASVAAAPLTAQQRACEAAFAELLNRSRLEFASGSAALSDSNRTLLDRLATQARGCSGNIRIEGHTDNVGAHPANLALSKARADAVSAALRARGVAASRLQTAGLGPDRPRAGNDTPQGRAQNRRIEFHIVNAP